MDAFTVKGAFFSLIMLKKWGFGRVCGSNSHEFESQAALRNITPRPSEKLLK